MLGGVGAVHQEGVLAGHAAEGEQAEVAVVAHARREQDEAVHAASVDRQFLNLPLIDHLREVGLGIFHQGSLADDLDGLDRLPICDEVAKLQHAVRGGHTRCRRDGGLGAGPSRT